MADAVIQQSVEKEVDFDLAAFDGKKIWCRLNRADSGKTGKAIILSHGLTGNPNEYIHMMARNYFTARGYDVYRFAYYTDGDDYRILTDCTLDIHGKDLNSVVDFVQQSYEKVFVCGHSYGGQTILSATPSVAAISFWDSSFIPKTFWEEEACYVPENDCYKFVWEIEPLVGKAMYEEGIQMTAKQASENAKNIKAPSQVIHAEICLSDGWRKGLYEALNEPKELCMVKGADHCFTKGDTVFDLLENTYNWFERF